MDEVGNVVGVGECVVNGSGEGRLKWINVLYHSSQCSIEQMRICFLHDIHICTYIIYVLK